MRSIQTLVRYTAYPLLAGGALLILWRLAEHGASYWPLFPLVAITGVASVAMLERVLPYEAAWNRDHDGDTGVDVVHLIVSYLLIQGAIYTCFAVRGLLPQEWALWPTGWPIAAQMSPRN